MSAPETVTSPAPSTAVSPEDPVFALHAGGKMETVSTVAVTGPAELSLAYTPGVARVCEAIAADPEMAKDYTWISNTCLLYTSPSPRDKRQSRMPSSA